MLFLKTLQVKAILPVNPLWIRVCGDLPLPYYCPPSGLQVPSKWAFLPSKLVLSEVEGFISAR